MAEQVVNVLVLASIYVLFGVGFTLILGALDVLNIAHGAILTAGAFAAFYVASAGLPLWLAAIVAAAVGGVLSMLVNDIALAPLRRRGGTGLVPLVSSLGAMTIIVTAIELLSDAQVVRLPFDAIPNTMWQFGGLYLSLVQAGVLLVSVIAVVISYYILNRTRFGRGIRATQFDEVGAKMVGIPTERIVRGTFFLAGSLAGVAGISAALLFNAMEFDMGDTYLLKGFIVVVLGGFGSVTGTMLAGVLVALLEVLSVSVGLSQWQDAIVFGLLIVILLVRPKGLFTRLEDVRP